MISGFDGLIVGSGPAGSIAAYILAKKGHRVLLVDQQRKAFRKFGECLPAVAGRLLASMELHSLLNSSEHQISYGQLSCWGSNNLFIRDSLIDPYGNGWHLNRMKFDLDVREAAISAGAEFLPGRIRSITREGEYWRFESEKTPIFSSWVFDATGRSCVIARKLGVNRIYDDDLTAIYTWVNASKDDLDTRTLVEAIDVGWWYTAKLSDGTRVVILHVGRERAQEILAMKNLWNTYLERTMHIKNVLKEPVPVQKLRSMSASGASLERFGGEGWLAIGDAAISFDPISSQGIFNALFTGMLAAEAVSLALSDDFSGLSHYHNSLAQIRTAYLDQHLATYRDERRWQNLSFWKLRQKFES